jgi:hypothetical protein
VNITRVPPSPSGPGVLTCRICGRQWPTTGAEDALLAELDAHDATHGPGRPETGAAVSSTTPNISTR